MKKLILVLALTVFCGSLANADQVYTFTGYPLDVPNFSFCANATAQACTVTGTFTVTNPIYNPAFPHGDRVFIPTSYSFSFGDMTLTGTSADVVPHDFTAQVNAKGQYNGDWELFVDNKALGDSIRISYNRMEHSLLESIFENGVLVGDGFGNTIAQYGTWNFGTWTVADAPTPSSAGDSVSIPEPGTLVLLGAGLLGLCALKFKRQ